MHIVKLTLLLPITTYKESNTGISLLNLKLVREWCQNCTYAPANWAVQDGFEKTSASVSKSPRSDFVDESDNTEKNIESHPQGRTVQASETS
jgi:hypothetical protein